MHKSVMVVSGGLDSVTMLYRAQTLGIFEDMLMVSFDYGQKHGERELFFARKHAKHLGIGHEIIDLRSVGRALARSGATSLVGDERKIPEGHYAEDNMKSTVVPNRNMMMLSIAASIGIANGFDTLSMAVHAGDHFVYPDCRWDFIRAAEAAIQVGNEGLVDNFKIFTPYVDSSKNDIAADTEYFNVPIEDTWSCYNGREKHCGRCGTCVERMEALASIGYQFSTVYYEDTEYYKEALNVHDQ